MLQQRRIFLLLICASAIGGLCLLRFRLVKSAGLLPEFLPGANRFRTDRVCANLGNILVNSAPAHAHRRQVIRESWGHPAVLRPLGLGVAYGVGSSPGPASQRPVDWEAETFGDMFQLPLEDEYRALPSKILSLLATATKACGHAPAPFVIKVDDDVFVNVFALRDLLKSILQGRTDKNIWCLVWRDMPVVRSNTSKWYVSKEQYGEDVYPDYCSGAAYILNRGVVQGLLSVANSSARVVLPAEDVHVTGVLAKEAGVGHVHIGQLYTIKTVHPERISSGQTVFAHLGPGSEGQVTRLWKDLLTERKKTRKSYDGL